jgi:cytochrome c
VCRIFASQNPASYAPIERGSRLRSCLFLIALLASGASAADPLPGEAAFLQQCGTCHVISPTPSPRQGPNLYRVIDRPAGTLKGFKYSKALAKVKVPWSRDRLDEWLTDSAKLVPGSIMNYRQGDPAVRAAIIDYLEAAGH